MNSESKFAVQGYKDEQFSGLSCLSPGIVLPLVFFIFNLKRYTMRFVD